VIARRFSPTGAAIAVILAAGAVTGCSSAPAPLAQSAAKRLQVGVHDVTVAASEGHLASAQSALDALQADLLTAAAAGQVTGPRSAKIQSAINLVTADLASAVVAAEPTATPTPTAARVTPAPKPGEGDAKCGKKCGQKDH
jgi:colicin import membrane protein